jgi:hypothetical protein
VGLVVVVMVVEELQVLLLGKELQELQTPVVAEVAVAVKVG